MKNFQGTSMPGQTYFIFFDLKLFLLQLFCFIWLYISILSSLQCLLTNFIIAVDNLSFLFLSIIHLFPISRLLFFQSTLFQLLLTLFEFFNFFVLILFNHQFFEGQKTMIQQKIQQTFQKRSYLLKLFLIFRGVKNIQKPQINNCHIIIKMKDLFGFETQGVNYDSYRPRYPPTMINRLMESIRDKNQYLDVATGTGQLLLQISPFFKNSKAIDKSQKMINVCDKKVKEKGIQNVEIMCQDFMKSNVEEKYNLITIGQALHWFPIRDFLEKCKTSLAQGGKLAVYVYNILNKIEGKNEEETKMLSRIWQEFYTNKMVANFQYNIDQLNTHYSDKTRYPFEEVFPKVTRQQSSVPLHMSKQGFLAYIKTLSGYNTYLIKYPTQPDPLIQLGKQIPQDAQISCYFDFVGIICQK